MIPRGVEIFVGLTPIDLRLYAEFGVMQSEMVSRAQVRRASTGTQ